MDLIEKTFYINLEYRKDRNEHLLEEFKKINFNKFERFNAIKHEYGPVGCCLSHLEVLKKAKELKLKNVLIIEDDLEFLVNREEIDKYIIAFLNDEELDVLCLAFNVKSGSLTNYNQYFYRTTDTQTASCYIIKEKMIDVLITNFEQSLHLLTKVEIDRPVLPKYAIDCTWKWLQPHYKFMISSVRVARQRASYSDNLKTYVNYGV